MHAPNISLIPTLSIQRIFPGGTKINFLLILSFLGGLLGSKKSAMLVVPESKLFREITVIFVNHTEVGDDFK